MSKYVAKHLRPKMQGWMDATQARISMTSSILGSMKSVKMVGISEAVLICLQEMRSHEFYKANSVRWMMVAYNASGKSPEDCRLSVTKIQASQFLGNIYSSNHPMSICSNCETFRERP